MRALARGYEMGERGEGGNARPGELFCSLDLPSGGSPERTGTSVKLQFKSPMCGFHGYDLFT